MILITLRKKSHWTMFLLPWYIYIYSSWVIVTWVFLGIYMEPLGVTEIFLYNFNSIFDKHLISCWCSPKQLHYLAKIFLLQLKVETLFTNITEIFTDSVTTTSPTLGATHDFPTTKLKWTFPLSSTTGRYVTWSYKEWHNGD